MTFGTINRINAAHRFCQDKPSINEKELLTSLANDAFEAEFPIVDNLDIPKEHLESFINTLQYEE